MAEFIDRPVGSPGFTDHEVIVPPKLVGVASAIAVPLVNEKKVGL